MTRHMKKGYATAALGALACWMASGSDARSQTTAFWIGGTGNFATSANWDNPSGDFVPEGSFGEEGQINNGGVAQLSSPYLNTSNAVGGPGNLILGNEIGESGTLEMTGTGELALEVGANVNRFIDVGGGEVGTGGTGTLTMADSSRLTVNNFFSGGQADSLVSLSDSATIIAENNVTFRAITQITGTGVTVDVTNDLTFGGNGVYMPQISAGGASVISAGGNASLNGALSLDFSTYTPSAGESWDLITASSVSGSFSEVTASGLELLPGSKLNVTTSESEGLVTVSVGLQQQLALNIDRSTGEVTIENFGSTPVPLDGYTLTSGGAAFLGTWNSLSDQLSGWDEAPNSSASALGELNAESQTDVAAESSISLGALYAPDLASLPFGTRPDEGIAFTYSDPTTGALVEADVALTGETIFNNMVLTIDPNTGEAQIKNDSLSLSPEIDAYTIRSANGSLISSNWDSLADQGVSAWDDASAGNGATSLSELNPTDATTFGVSTAYDLGAIFDTALGAEEGDITFEFLLTGETEARTGVVFFGDINTPVGVTGDYNNDGVVDAADFTVWRNAEGTSTVLPNDPVGGVIGQGQYDQWAANYGATAGASAGAGVPEPSAVCLAAMAGGLIASSRRRLGRRRADAAAR